MIYAVKKNDSTVSILRLFEDVDVEGELQKWPEEERQKVVSWRKITEDQIPSDRTFRDEWTDDFDTSTIDVDIEKAKQKKLAEIRAKRNEILMELDKEYIIAIEKQDVTKQKEIAEKKQRLRDITKDVKFKNIIDVEGLKSYVPEVFK